jgi:hypothetical protein
MLVLFEFHAPYLSKAALSDDILAVKAVSVDLGICAATFLFGLKL